MSDLRIIGRVTTCLDGVTRDVYEDAFGRQWINQYGMRVYGLWLREDERSPTTKVEPSSAVDFELQIPGTLYREMLAQALSALPNQCGGLLAGRSGRVTHRYSLGNALASPVRFESDPKARFAALKDMRHQDTDLLAIYHSCPTSETVPSRTYLERNVYGVEVVHFIISLQGGAPTVRAWSLDESNYHPAEWSTLPDDDTAAEDEQAGSSNLMPSLASTPPFRSMMNQPYTPGGNEPTPPPAGTSERDADWFVRSCGEEVGPFTIEELKAKAAAGVIGPEDLVRNHQCPWTPAKQWAFLTARLQSTSVPTAVAQQPDARMMAQAWTAKGSDLTEMEYAKVLAHQKEICERKRK